MGKRAEQEARAIQLYAEGSEIPAIREMTGVSENTLRKWKKWGGTEWDEARAAVRKGLMSSMEDVGKRLRRSREITAQLTGDLKSQGNMGQILNESLRIMMFDILDQIDTAAMDEEKINATIGKINKMTLMLQRAETAAARNIKNEVDIRKQALTDASKAVDAVAKTSGLSDATVAAIKAKILGISA